MKIEKQFQIDAPQDKVWEFLSSPEKVGECFPGCEEVTALGDNKYKAAIRVEIGPIKTVFNVNFEETENRPKEFMAYTSTGEETHRASRLKAVSTLTLSAIDKSRTQVVYTSELSIVGRLGKFGAGMMKKKADAMGDEFAQEMILRIVGPDAAPAPVVPAATGLSGRQKAFAVALVGGLIILLAWYLLR